MERLQRVLHCLILFQHLFSKKLIMQFIRTATAISASIFFLLGCSKGDSGGGGGSTPTPLPPTPIALSTARIDNTSALTAATNYNVKPVPVIRLSFNNAVDRATGGSSAVKVNGRTTNLAYNGKASLTGASLQAPGIAPRVTDMKATLNFSNDTVTLSDSGLKMGNSDMQFSGTVRSFTKPVARRALCPHTRNVCG